jgi:hypothetical protein
MNGQSFFSAGGHILDRRGTVNDGRMISSEETHDLQLFP